MALTKKGFESEERAFQPDDQYGQAGPSTEALLDQLAATQNAPAAKGLGAPYNAGDGSASSSPRRHGTAQEVPAGNPASTGAAGPWPKGAANMPGPDNTGAGKGSKTVKTYRK